MKLLLTSNGLVNNKLQEAFASLLTKPIRDCKALIVSYAKNDQDLFYVEETKKELQRVGLQHISVFNLHDPINMSEEQVDIIYMCGGNTFSILSRIKELNFDAYVKNAVVQGAVYVGVSAGSIMAGPTIEIAGWGAEADSNEIGLTNLESFNFIDSTVFPHFKESQADEVQGFQNLKNIHVNTLADGQGIKIVDSEINLV